MPIFRIMGGRSGNNQNSSSSNSASNSSSTYPAQRAQTAANQRYTYPGHRGMQTQSLNPPASNPAAAASRQYASSAPPGQSPNPAISMTSSTSTTVVRGAPTQPGARAPPPAVPTETTTRPGAYQVTRTTSGVSMVGTLLVP